MSKLVFKEIRLSGSGGQGLILGGIILANAAVNDGNKVTQTQSYGPESRGGYSRADVIISNEDINFPEAIRQDILLSLTQEACDKYSLDLKQGGILIVDTTFVKYIAIQAPNTYELPFTDIAQEQLGTQLVTNILSLAFLVRISGIVNEKSLEKAIRKTVKPAFVDLNIKAMKLGFSLATKEKRLRQKEEDLEVQV
ncbi:MAG: 2-oxoacid:acceptor oxidoreductase family protein [Candidatus Zophobacter franzmannii]|jgi:2-oxoglutarate ferredoxin oxidoreductase subunit gamma|nr:2-oxoacid:acceptor oxidoreductase family protein [Candidatus Zophobacter franzmannii]